MSDLYKTKNKNSLYDLLNKCAQFHQFIKLKNHFSINSNKQGHLHPELQYKFQWRSRRQCSFFSTYIFYSIVQFFSEVSNWGTNLSHSLFMLRSSFNILNAVVSEIPPHLCANSRTVSHRSTLNTSRTSRFQERW